MSTTNILDLNNRIDALASAIPRTASGTTIAQLSSAIGQLSTEQQNTCCIYVNTNYVLRRILRDSSKNAFSMFLCTGSNAFAEYRFNANDSTFKEVSSGTSITVKSWTLYYQGTPIS